MRLGIVCAATQTLGHAAVARSLAEKARSDIPGLERILIISDQSELMTRMAFLPPGIDVLPLGSKLPPLDLLFIDATPFRRPDVVEIVVNSMPNPKPRVVVGHTGWVIPNTEENVDEWARALSLLGASRVLLYHPSDICGGECHIGRLGDRLGVPVGHSGLLLPHVTVSAAPRKNVFMALAGGGGGNTVAGAYHAAQDRLLELAQSILSRRPEWECEFVAGPYAPEREPMERLRLLRGITDVAQHIVQYQFSITLAGYSACCEHIVAGVPTIVLPVEHAEQLANAEWVRRYLRSVDLQSDGGIRFGTPRAPAPTAFHWQQLAL